MVQHVSLRHTAIETPDGDRVILPNSFLTRSTVTVLAKRAAILFRSLCRMDAIRTT